MNKYNRMAISPGLITECFPDEEFIIQEIRLDNLTLKAIKPRWKRMTYIAVINFLTNKKPELNASYLEKVQGYLEALYHLCEAQDWNAIKYILNMPITIIYDSINLSLPFSEYLLFRGLDRELFKICEDILNTFSNTNIQLELIYLLKARALSGIVDRQTACDFLKKICEICDKSSEYYLEAMARLAMQEIYLGNYEQGVKQIKYILNQLKQKSVLPINLIQLKAEIIQSLAWSAMNANEFNQATFYYEEAIKIIKETGLIYKMINPLLHQGVIQRKLNNYDRAIIYLKEAKEISTIFMKEENLEWVDHHLAYVFLNQGNHSSAEDLCRSCIEKAKRRHHEENISGNSALPDYYEQLGLISLAQGKINTAVEYLEMSLALRNKIKNKHGMASSLKHLSIALWHKKHYLKACTTLYFSLKMYNELQVLSKTRVLRTIKLVIIWTIGKKGWTM